jgi:hypothetical protein
VSTPVSVVGPSFLTSWKEIAQYMGKGIRTVQRWEQRFQLPVRRVAGAGYKGTVLARPSDLDAWVLSASGHRATRDWTSVQDGHGPALEVLKKNLEVAKNLQHTHVVLRSEVSEALRSLIENCQQLKNNKLEARAEIH